MREFHLHTKSDGTLHQAVLVTVTRDTEEQTLQIHEVCVIMQNGTQESKVMVNMDMCTDLMAVKPNGNIDPKSMFHVKQMFYDMLTEESKSEMDLQEFMGNSGALTEYDRILVANEASMSAHPINQSIEEIVNERLQNPTRKK